MVLGLIGQVRIASGGQDRVMTEDLLYLDQIDAGFNQVGCIAMAKECGVMFFLGRRPR